MLRSDSEKGKNIQQPNVAGYIAGAFFTFIFFYLINRYWPVIPHIKSSFVAVLWVINISMLFSIIANIVLAIYNGYYFRHILKLVENLFGVAVILTFYKIFPHDLSETGQTIAYILIIIGLIGTVISILVEIARLCRMPSIE
jgi:hypothetical protein